MKWADNHWGRVKRRIEDNAEIITEEMITGIGGNCPGLVTAFWGIGLAYYPLSTRCISLIYFINLLKLTLRVTDTEATESPSLLNFPRHREHCGKQKVE